MKFELVASPPEGQAALQAPARDASKRPPLLRISEAAATQANQMFAQGTGQCAAICGLN